MARAVALGVAAFLAALPGEAQQASDVPMQSPRSGSVEFRLGGYRPQLDKEAGLADTEGNPLTPFADVFGESDLLLVEAEMQRFFYQGIGSAGVSLSLGYAEKYASALIPGTDVRSAESTGFHVLPVRLRAVYRFDYPALRWGIPLVPYVKPGLVFSHWWVTKGGEIETVGDVEGRGNKFGWEVAAGASFLLDVLEPRLARDFDSDLGINHSYVFAEFTYAKVNNFGGEGFNLSDSYWMFGLALDY